MENIVHVNIVREYDPGLIYRCLDTEVFESVRNARKVVLKPNWVREAHLERAGEWEYVITHPAVITAVLIKVIELMPGGGRISILDGPEFSTSFEKLISHYPVNDWKVRAVEKGIMLEIIDLRDEIWVDNGNVVIKRAANKGDIRGSVQFNLRASASEFYQHKKSQKGYFGADSDIDETNKAHDGFNNLYRVSATVIEADVFINLPKLKTHKKAGITCCMKNLVGINTYRNYLPHCNLGTKDEGGDQFMLSGSKQKVEGLLMPVIHQYIRTNTILSKLFSPVMRLGKKVFGTNQETIRGGSWYGNDTIWRTIIDINKILLYGDSTGSLKEDKPGNRKAYIAVVDSILCGEGNGPKIPDEKRMNYLIQGSNPAVIDTVCSELMGFDHNKIPSVRNAFIVNSYKITTARDEEIEIHTGTEKYFLDIIPSEMKYKIRPSDGWKDYLEK